MQISITIASLKEFKAIELLKEMAVNMQFVGTLSSVYLFIIVYVFLCIYKPHRMAQEVRIYSAFCLF